MFISKVSIKNFKSIANIELSLAKGKNILIGKNNAGKSNILKAIDLVIGESDPSWSKKENISRDDFHNNNTNQPIEIFLTITREELNGSPENLDFLNELAGALSYFPSQKFMTFQVWNKSFRVYSLKKMILREKYG